MTNKHSNYAKGAFKIHKILIDFLDEIEPTIKDNKRRKSCVIIRNEAYKIRGMGEKIQDLEESVKELERLDKKHKRKRKSS